MENIDAYEAKNHLPKLLARVMKGEQIVIEYERPKQIIRDLLTLAHQNNLSSYDASYLNLATRKGVPIAILDK